MYKNHSQNNKTKSIDEIIKEFSLAFSETLQTILSLEQQNKAFEGIRETNSVAISSNKEVLTIKEVVEYTGLSKSTIYKKTMNREIPHYKVSKTLYFKFDEVKKWLLSNKIESIDEVRMKIRNAS
jgi:excisionase family DNA binding protein